MNPTLQQMRYDAGLSTVAVAKALGTSRSRLYDWEHGRFVPSLRQAAGLAKLYGVRLEAIVAACYD